VPRALPALAPNDENDVERRQRLRREHADRLARGLTELQAEVALIRAVAQGDRAEAVLPPLPRAQRIALHALAEGLGLWHESVGPADRRALRVRRWEDEEEVLQEVLQDAQEGAEWEEDDFFVVVDDDEDEDEVVQDEDEEEFEVVQDEDELEVAAAQRGDGAADPGAWPARLPAVEPVELPAPG